MDVIEYEQVQVALVAFGNFIRDVNLMGFIAAIDRAETLGPIIDPTLYYQAGGKMQNVRRLATAALQFQDEVNRQLEGAEEVK